MSFLSKKILSIFRNQLLSICGILLLIAIRCTPLQAQQLGLHPNGQNWKLMESPAIRVIYPEGMETRAQRIASIINHISDSCSRSVGKKKLKLDMVLLNRVTMPNGIVAFAPLRSELNCTPPQSNILVGSMDWLDILSIHEFRHVQQNANTKNGLTKLVYCLSGQTGWSLFAYLSVPNWYFEGDAVITETALSECGRGRTAFFSNEFRALSKAGKTYGYQTIRNGSFRKLLPDHYRLGYMMLQHARKEKGNDITAKVLREGSAYKGLFYPFSRAMKRNTGYSTPQLYKASLEASQKKWATLTNGIKPTPHKSLVALPKRTVTNYHYSRFLSNGSLVSNRNSFNSTHAVYRINEGKTKKLSNIGYSFDDYLTVGHDIAAWTETSRDKRRGNENFSDVVLLDTKTGKKKRLTCHTRYFSPAVSPAGDRVAVIYITREQENFVYILNASTGEVMQKMPSPENTFLSRIAWVNENEWVCIGKRNSKMAIIKFNSRDASTTYLTPWSAHTLEGLSVSGNQVYFSASYTGIDNIFRASVDGSKKVQQVTSDSIGAYSPDVSPDGKTLVYSAFTYKGFSAESMELKDASLQEINLVEPIDMPIYADARFTEEGGDVLKNVPLQNYTSRPYQHLFRGMRLHSWNVSPSFATPSVTIKMNNILNDVAIELGGGINRNEKGKSFYNASFSVGRYFLETALQSSYNNRSADYLNARDSVFTKNFSETSAGIKTGVPLAWIHGNFATFLQAYVSYTYRMLSNIKTGESSEPSVSLGTLEYSLSFSTLRRQALQHVGSRLGLAAKCHFSHAPGRSNEKLQAECKGYLPGIGKNDHLVLRAAIQSEPLKNVYQFVDNFAYPRGFAGTVNDQFSMVSVTYGFPILYPDRGLRGITYFKRVRTNLFYDTGNGRTANTNTRYTSAGFELIFDNVHMNVLPLSFGFRQAYLLEGPGKGGNSGTFFMATDF